MLDNVMRLREPAAWIAILVTVASIVLALVRFVVELGTGLPLAAAAQNVALDAMGLTLVVIVVALVWACVFHQPTAGARRLTLAGAWVLTLGTVVTLVGALVGVTASVGVLGMVLEFLGGLLDIILKAGGAAILWLIHRGLSAGRIGGEQEVPASGATALEPQPEPEPERAAPVWTADAASGSVWTSASDAATGAAPTAQGNEQAGWRPVRRAVEAPEEPGDDDPYGLGASWGGPAQH